jgi:hypothetical protein
MPRQLTDTDFSNKYNAVVNHIDQNAGFGGFNNNSDVGCLFETYGKELDFVIKTHNENPKKVWTIIEADGDMYISAGYHFVNRIGYFITEQEWENETEEYLLD